MAKHEVGDVWKDKNEYCVQFPKGIMAFKTLTKASLWREELLKSKEGGN